MKSLLRYSLVLLVLLGSFIHASFENSLSLGDIHFEVPHNWDIKESRSKVRIGLTHKDSIATLNIYFREMDELITANAVQQKRSISHYDGWMTPVNKSMPEAQVKRANTDEGHVAIYLQQELDPQLQIIEKLVAEYYFIKDSYYYVVTVYCDKANWLSIKDDLEYFFATFWVGSEPNRPTLKEDLKDLTSWHYPANKLNQNYIEASPMLQKNLELNWEFQSESTNDSSAFPFVLNQNEFFFLHNSRIVKLNSQNGQKIWEYKLENKSKNYLAYHSNLIFLIESGFETSLKALSASSGEIIYKLNFKHNISSPSFLYDFLYLTMDGSLYCYEVGSGRLMWKKSGSYLTKTVLSTQAAIVAEKSNHKIDALNPENGDSLWSIKHEALSHSMLANDTYVYLPTRKSAGHHELHCVNLYTGEREWVFNQSILEFNFDTSPVLSEKHLLLSGKISNNNPYELRKNVPVLFNLDPESGKTNWKKELSGQVSRPIISNTYAYFFNMFSNKNQVIDTLSGEDIPISDISTSKESLIKIIIHKSQIYNILKNNNTLIIKSFS